MIVIEKESDIDKLKLGDVYYVIPKSINFQKPESLEKTNIEISKINVLIEKKFKDFKKSEKIEKQVVIEKLSLLEQFKKYVKDGKDDSFLVKTFTTAELNIIGKDIGLVFKKETQKQKVTLIKTKI
jgi:hypothetical protein